jgi:Bacterial Ig domain
MSLPSDFGTQALYSAWYLSQTDTVTNHGNVTETTQHAAMMGLVPQSALTKVYAANSGNWSTAANWYPNGVPGNGDKVGIGPGVSVTFDTAMPTTPGSPAIKTVRVDGTLYWSRSVSTAMLVDTFVGGPGAIYDMGDGTTGDVIPANVTAEMVFADNGPIDVSTDIFMLGRGAMWHDKTRICGAAKTAFLHAYDNTMPANGATSVRLEFAPTNWAVGDTIVLGGNRSYGRAWSNQYSLNINHGRTYETRVISAISGDTVSWTTPLIYSHIPPPVTLWSSSQTFNIGGFTRGSDGNHYISIASTNLNNNPVGDGGVHWASHPPLRILIANLTRNVIFRPQTPQVIGNGFHQTAVLNGAAINMQEEMVGDGKRNQRPHTMFMHNEDVDCRYALGVHLGRTSKFNLPHVLALTQSVAAGGFLTLNGSYAPGGVPSYDSAFQIVGCGSAGTLTAVGLDINGNPQTEVMALNTQTIGGPGWYGTKLFKSGSLTLQCSAAQSRVTAGIRCRTMAMVALPNSPIVGLVATQVGVQNSQETDLDLPAPANWASGTTYAANAQVRGSDSNSYTSNAGGNVGHDPTTDAGVHWTQTGLRFEPLTNLHNIQGRYPFHVHKTPLTGIANPAYIEGCVAYDCPGWGFSHHSSHAVFNNNVAFDFQGAGFVGEGGDETGLWVNNCAIGSRSGNLDISQKDGSDKATLDAGCTGAGMWFTSRAIKLQGGYLSDVAVGAVYNVRLATELIAPFQFDQPELLRGISSIGEDVDDHHPLDHFDTLEVMASSYSTIEVVKANSNQGHEHRTVINNVLGWSVREGIDVTYTQHYSNRNMIFIRGYGDAVNSGASPTVNPSLATPTGSGFMTGNVVSDQTFVNMHCEGFSQGVYLDHNHTERLSFIRAADNGRILVDITTVNCTKPIAYVFEDPPSYSTVTDASISIDQLLTSASISATTTALTLATARPVAPPTSATVTLITGTKVDEIGTCDYPLGTDAFAGLFGWSQLGVQTEIATKGYYTNNADSKKYVYLQEYYASRLTGEPFMQLVPMEVTSGGYITGTTPNNGTANLDNVHAPVISNWSVSNPKNTPVTIPVVSRATHPDGASMFLSGFMSPMHSDCQNNNDGTLAVYPRAGFVGTENIYVWVSDQNGKTTRATIAFTTTNAAPVLTANADTASTNYQTAVTFNVLANDVGTGISITAAVVTGGSGVGTVSFSGNNLTFTPNSAFFGVAAGTYTITDATMATATGNWSVVVSSPPPPPSPPNVVGFTTRCVRATIEFNAMQNDSDPAGLPLTLIAFQLANAGNGQTDFTNDGNAFFRPSVGFSGTAVINYTVFNGGASASGQINVICPGRVGWGMRFR